MFAVAPISNVEARIGSIQRRVDPGSAASAAAGGFDAAYQAAVAAPPPAVDFDPFGDVYQAAVEASRTQQVPTALTAFSSARLAMGGTGSSVGQIGGYGTMPAPAELAAHGNGHVPGAALEPIGQGGHRLWGPAADAWQGAVAAARAEGIDLRVTDSYRSFDQQVDLAARKGLYKDGGLGATPGTSNHGWGLAVDVDVSDPAALSWIRANGYRFGFVEAVQREPWHWEYRPAQA